MPENSLAPAAVISQTEADLRAELALERGRREGMSASRPAAPPPPREKDALDEFREKTQLPEDQIGLLDKAIDQRIRGRVGPALKRMEDDRQKDERAREYRQAIDNAMVANPDIAADPQRFAAAAAAADQEVRIAGRTLPPGEFVRATVAKFRQLFPNDKKTKAPPPDYVEGASSPGAVAPLGVHVEAEKPKEPSRLSVQYGDDDGDIIDLAENADPNKILDQMTQSYAEGKNVFLEEKGMRTFMPGVARPLMKRRRAAKKAAAAAAAR